MSASTTTPASPSPSSIPTKTATTAAAFLSAALDYYRRLGIRVRRVLTDNGGCYRPRAFNARCAQQGLRHRFTRPFTPRTNGKAERFIQTALRKWAYAHPLPHLRTARPTPQALAPPLPLALAAR